MGFLDDLVKVALPAVAGTFLGPAAGGLFSGATGIMANPAVQSALLSGGIGLLTGAKPKDALKSALLGGLGQTMFSGMGKTADATGMAASNAFPYGAMSPEDVASSYSSPATQNIAQTVARTGGAGAINPVTAQANTMSGELLKGIGMAGDSAEGNLLFKLLNTNMGEGIAAGLVAQLLAGDEEEEDNRGSSRSILALNSASDSSGLFDPVVAVDESVDISLIRPSSPKSPRSSRSILASSSASTGFDPTVD